MMTRKIQRIDRIPLIIAMFKKRHSEMSGSDGTRHHRCVSIADKNRSVWRHRFQFIYIIITLRGIAAVCIRGATRSPGSWSLGEIRSKSSSETTSTTAGRWGPIGSRSSTRYPSSLMVKKRWGRRCKPRFLEVSTPGASEYSTADNTKKRVLPGWPESGWRDIQL